MAAGAGRALASCVGALERAEVVAPVGASLAAAGDGVTVLPWLKFAHRSGGPFRVLTALHHLEAVVAPLVWSILRRRRPALLVCSVALFVGMGGLLLSRLLGVPYIVYAQGEELSAPLQLPDGHWRRRSTAAVLQRATCVVAISRFAAAAVCRYGVAPARVSLVNPAVDVSEKEAVPAGRAELLRSQVGGRSVLLIVGRLAQVRKGFDRTIEALSIVRHASPDVSLVVVGPGDPNPLRVLAHEVGVVDAVFFAGEVSRADLLAWYDAADVFVMPTRVTQDGDSEGFGLVYLEANLFGKPVIGGDNAGVRDAVLDGETGLLVDGDDPRAIAAAILRLVGDPALARSLGATGRERVLREFSGERQRQAFAAIVAGVQERGGCP
jgi:phosphatidylinositol alpha-1,6-mannosyltransferase